MVPYITADETSIMWLLIITKIKKNLEHAEYCWLNHIYTIMIIWHELIIRPNYRLTLTPMTICVSKYVQIRSNHFHASAHEQQVCRSSRASAATMLIQYLQDFPAVQCEINNPHWPLPKPMNWGHYMDDVNGNCSHIQYIMMAPNRVITIEKQPSGCRNNTFISISTDENTSSRFSLEHL